MNKCFNCREEKGQEDKIFCKKCEEDRDAGILNVKTGATYELPDHRRNWN